MSSNQKAVCFAIVSILLVGNIYFSFKYFSAQKELIYAKSSLEEIQSNKKYLDFNKMFIDKILKRIALWMLKRGWSWKSRRATGQDFILTNFGLSSSI